MSADPGAQAVNHPRAVRGCGPQVAGLLLLALFGGCQDTARTVDPLNVLGMGGPPIRIGVTTLDLSPPLLLPKWEALRLALSHHLQEPVQFELMTPRQIRVHLGTGRLQFAMLQPGELPEVVSAGTGEILAVPLNLNNQPYRQGLIIVPPKSTIDTLSNARSVRFHFLPVGDRLNDAAIGAMIEAGVPRSEVTPGLLPGLSMLTYHINSLEVAKSVVVEDKAAGVIDEYDYNQWPQTGGSLLLLRPSKDQVRIIGKTVRIPGEPFMVSVKTDPELRERVRTFLFDEAPRKHRLALAALNYKGFAPPVDAREYEPVGKIWHLLKPKTPAATGSAGRARKSQPWRWSCLAPMSIPPSCDASPAI